jgi:hypothetical protein
MAKPLPSGVYAPLPAFFSNTDELGKHTLRFVPDELDSEFRSLLTFS